MTTVSPSPSSPSSDEMDEEESTTSEHTKGSPPERGDAAGGDDEEDQDESSPNNDDDGRRGAVASTRRALLAAVEGGGGEGTPSSPPASGEATGDEEQTPSRRRSRRGVGTRPIVSLFFYPGRGQRAKEKRENILGLVRGDRSNFHRGHVRRLFAGLTDILDGVCDGEEYVPASAYEEEDDDEEAELDGNEQQPRVSMQPEIVPDEESTEALQFMKACALLVGAHLDGLLQRKGSKPKNSSSITTLAVEEEVLSVAEALHSTLFSLQTCGTEGLKTQSSITAMCEKFWHNQFQYRELLVTQLVPLLLVKSLDGQARFVDVKKMFALRNALDLLDFDDGSIAYLRSLLLKTVSSPLYLKTVEGRRFVACLFHLHSSLVVDLHAAIRGQIPIAKKTILWSYGDVYLRAWREASALEGGDSDNDEGCGSSNNNTIRKCIEENALQDLMYAALHASTPSTATAVRTVLTPLHESKKAPEIDSLLYRMYGPILWRAVRAANPRVRVNAAAILADTFPLRDPTSRRGSSQQQTAADVSIRKATDALMDLLGDTHPRVRVAGADATARTLTAFWDALPSDCIRTLLTDLVTEHASDASSSVVRASAVSSITLLLEAPHSHAVLRDLLPLLGNLIHDKVERVRLSVVKMLLSIKKIRGIKFYHVVPVDHLLARLAAEGDGTNNPRGPVASALTNLLLNSYFPQGEHVTGALQVQRTLSFLSRNPEAAAVFYSNLSRHLSVNSVSKLTAMLLKCLLAAVRADVDKENASSGGRDGRGKKKRQRNRDSGGGDGGSSSQGTGRGGTNKQRGANSDSGGGGLTASNTGLMAAIAETICTLWDSIAPALSEIQNQPCMDFLVDAFSGSVIADVHGHFEAKAKGRESSSDDDLDVRSDCHRVCASVLRCAGRMPADSVTGLSSKLTSKLADMAEHCTDNLTPHISLLCLWGQTENVANSVAESISSSFHVDNDGGADCHKTPHKRKAKKRKGKSTNSRSTAEKESVHSIPVLPPDVALKALGSILSGADPSCIAAREAILSSDAACSTIESSLERAMVAAEQILNASEMSDLAFSETDVSLILTAYETYERFALHKAAMKGGHVELSAQANTMLTWVTNAVVPALLQKTPPLGDLNLSKISSVGDSPIPPFSPLPSEPPRSRANRNTTPLRFSSFSSAGLPVNYDHGVPTFVYGRAAAVTLIKSSVVFFAEWLAVGGEGAGVIASSAVKWCEALTSLSTDGSVLCELLPVFCRLLTQLVKRTGDCSMLGAILTVREEIEEGSVEESTLQKTISSLLTLRSSADSTRSPNEEVVSTVLQKASESAKEGTRMESESTAPPATEVMSSISSTARIALSTVMNSGPGTVLLAKELSKQLSDHQGKENELVFEARCVEWLCREGGAKGAHAGEGRRIARSIDIDWVTKDRATANDGRQVAEG